MYTARDGRDGRNKRAGGCVAINGIELVDIFAFLLSLNAMQCNAINAFLDYHHTIINLNYLNEELIIFIIQTTNNSIKVIISFLFFFFLFPYYYIRSGGVVFLSSSFVLLLPFKKLN